MKDGVMGIGRWLAIIVGVLMDLMGTIWILQGINILPGSFMTGQTFWAWMGVGMVIVGTMLVVLALRRTSTPPSRKRA